MGRRVSRHPTYPPAPWYRRAWAKVRGIDRKLAIRARRHEYGRLYRYTDWRLRHDAAVAAIAGMGDHARLEGVNDRLELALRAANSQQRFAAIAPFAVDITFNGNRIGATPQEARSLAESLGNGNNVDALVLFVQAATRVGVVNIGTSFEIGVLAEVGR